MSTLLNDKEIQLLFGTVIQNADPSCLRPNSYVLRLGAEGEFLNTGKTFELSAGTKKKGVKISPGHAVGVTAFETLDFRRETVQKVFPDHDLHGLVSPTTDLSREGIVAPTTQVDAGFYGTLNWTLSNTSSEERKFVHKERIYRLTLFKLAEGERPEKLYSGDYQEQLGYVRSRRSGPPIGMKDTEFEDAHVKGGPEDILEELIKSGYPWHALGSRLKHIDQQFKTVTDEYADIRDSIDSLTSDVRNIKERQNDTANTVRQVLREEAGGLQNRWLLASGAWILGGLGLALSVFTNDVAKQFVSDHGLTIGLFGVAVSVAGIVILSRQK